MISSTRRAMSLIETLLAGALLTLTFTLALAFLVPTFRNTSRGGIRVAMQQQASLALDRLVIDLERGAPASVSLLPAPGPGEVAGVAVQRLQSYTSSGTQVWEPELIVYYWLPKVGRLKREVWRSGVRPALAVQLLDYRPARITRDDLLAIVNDGSGRETLIADGVSDFSVDYPPPPAQQPYRIRLTLTRETYGRKEPEVLTLERSLALRNQW